MEFNKENILSKIKAAQQTTIIINEGLKAYILKIYNYITSKILLTNIITIITIY